jgi:hypothetical protein
MQDEVQEKMEATLITATPRRTMPGALLFG